MKKLLMVLLGVTIIGSTVFAQDTGGDKAKKAAKHHVYHARTSGKKATRHHRRTSGKKSSTIVHARTSGKKAVKNHIHGDRKKTSSIVHARTTGKKATHHLRGSAKKAKKGAIE